MVNATNLLLVREAGQFLVQRARRREVTPKRFFHHDALPAGTISVEQTGPVHILDDHPELAGESRQVK